MKCYVINLDRSTDRFSHMADQCDRLGLELKRVSAVDGRLFSADQLQASIAADSRWPMPLTPAEIGCFLSHRRCLEEFVQSSDLHALIVEDDIDFARDAASLLQWIDWIPSDADLVKIETSGKRVLLDESTACPGTRYSVARLRSTHILSAGYIISRAAARQLLQRMDRVYAPIDQFIFSAEHGIFNELVIYQCTPALCRQSGFASTIMHERVLARRRPKPMRRIWREVRRLGRQARIGLWGFWVNTTTRQRWMRIPFRLEI